MTRRMMNRGILLSIAAAALCGCENPGEAGPVPIASWQTVSAGTYNSCGVTLGGIASCWGFYSAPASSGNPFGVSAVPVPVPGASALDSVTVGGGVACGLDPAGAAWCWGQEFDGELGNGGAANDSTRVPVPVAGGLRFRAISAGYTTVCALTAAGEAYCWGSNGGGQLGIGSIAPGEHRTAPVRVVGPARFKAVSVGNGQSCGLTDDGRAYCWGGGSGAAGVVAPDSAFCQGTNCWYPTPQPVSTSVRFRSISAGNGFTCAVATDGAGWCWGALFDEMSRYGVLGSGSTQGSATPVRVAGGLTFTEIDTGTRAACGVATDGSAYCWGSNSSGELGIGRRDDSAHPTPQRVAGGMRFRTLSLGEVSCGITPEARLYCWGVTAAGHLGNGQSAAGYRATPTRVLDPVPAG
jgi:alpha-tubulin suppressor-like RCC1 family protein